MTIIPYALAIVVAAIVILLALTRMGVWIIERNNPPVGEFADIADTRMHYVHVPARSPDLPPVVFIHGASGNLRDQMLPTRPLLEGRAELLYVDRPGHGWSDRGTGNETLSGQADRIAGLMDRLGLARAVIAGHSLGGAVAATFAVEHPDRVAGLLFIAPATHPWPGGDTSWYYRLSAMPVLGRVFTELFSLPGGLLSMAAASANVFSPNRMPQRYARDAGIELVLRPASFRANAVDVASLSAQLERVAPRYGEIAAPTIIISGNRDTVVYEELHSGGLERDIAGARLVWVDNLGHKPDWIAPDLIAAAIESLAGRSVDLDAAAQGVAARISGDAFALEAQRSDEPDIAQAAR